MSWVLLLGVTSALGLSLLVAASRRAELARMERSVRTRERVERQGGAKAKLQHPVVDLSRCLGCATCVAVCPEEGVLELVHGQAMVVRGARCQGISACERECPVGAITVTLADLAQRDDVPVLDESLEAHGRPGLFLAGEVTAQALIRTAVDHGTAVAAEVARRAESDPGAPGQLDLCIVGAGPAGLACALEARRRGLSFVVLEQEASVGGTVARYPRRKLVLARGVDLPLYGRLESSTYTKEELVALWRQLTLQHDLPVRTGATLEAVEDAPGGGGFVVHAGEHEVSARHVCLALGRRGTPRRLGVEGEELPKVTYALLDARSYAGRRVLVVGGGDAAIEAAAALAEQEGCAVTLSYRRDEFFRLGPDGERRLAAARATGRLEVVLASRVRAIRATEVDLEVGEAAQLRTLPNDDVFVLAGGVPPTELLQRAGVSFDPALREAPAPLGEQGPGLVRALTIGFCLALGALGFAAWNADYYALPAELRPAHDDHAWLRPGKGIGLALGIVSTLLIVVNLAYLVRRLPTFRLEVGSLKTWMTSHVATGILAVLCALLHGAMAPRNTPGGHAFWALAVLLVTGAIGRYFYAWVPRAANGRELELAEVKARLGRVSDEWDGGQRRFREAARDRIEALIEKRQWRGSFLGRVLALVSGRRELSRALAAIEQEGRDEGVAPDQVRETVRLARRAYGTALMTAHYEDLRAVLGTWRYVHRWAALLMVCLVVLHVVFALAYGSILGGGVG